MSIIIKISVIAIVYLVLASVLSAQRPEYVFLLRICAIIIVFILVSNDFAQLISELLATFNVFNIKSEHINLLIRVSGIAIITEFICNTLADSNEKSLSYIISLVSKTLIIFQSLPVINELIIFCLELLE